MAATLGARGLVREGRDPIRAAQAADAGGRYRHAADAHDAQRYHPIPRRCVGTAGGTGVVPGGLAWFPIAAPDGIPTRYHVGSPGCMDAHAHAQHKCTKNASSACVHQRTFNAKAHQGVNRMWATVSTYVPMGSSRSICSVAPRATAARLSRGAASIIHSIGHCLQATAYVQHLQYCPGGLLQ